MLDGALYILRRLIEDAVDEAGLKHEGEHVSTENVFITKIVANVGGDGQTLPPVVLDLETGQVHLQTAMAKFQMQDLRDPEFALQEAKNRRAGARRAFEDADAEVERAYELAQAQRERKAQLEANS